MIEVLEFLHAEWAGAPLVIWLAGTIIFAFLLLTLALVLVRRIHLQWKGSKRQFLVETDNVTTRARGKKR